MKHHHSDFPVAVDSPGTDTWRHRSAGATSVALVSPKEVALFRYTEETLLLDDIISRFPETDIVLVECFHLEPRAKIEVLSDQNGERLCPVDENVLAVVGAAEHDESASNFSRDNIKPLVDLIERKVLGLLGDVRTHSEVGSQSESHIRSSSKANQTNRSEVLDSPSIFHTF